MGTGEPGGSHKPEDHMLPVQVKVSSQTSLYCTDLMNPRSMSVWTDILGTFLWQPHGPKKTPTQLNLDLPFQGHSRTPSNLVASSSPMLPLAMTVWPYNLLSLIKLSYCIWLLMRIYMWYPSQTGHSFRIFLSQDETLNHLLYYIHTPYGCEQASVSQTTMYMHVMLPVFSFSPSPPYPLPTNFPWCLCTKEVVSHFFIPNTIKCFSVVI